MIKLIVVIKIIKIIVLDLSEKEKLLPDGYLGKQRDELVSCKCDYYYKINCGAPVTTIAENV